MSELRDFLYLDRSLVRNLLAQVEGGQFDETTERGKAVGKGGLGGKLGAGPVALNAQKSSEHEYETEAVIRQVAASEFDRLYSHIDSAGLVVLDEISNSNALEEIRRKQFVEADARFRLAGFQQLTSLLSTFTDLLPVLQGFAADVQLDAEQQKTLEAFSSLAKSDDAVSVIGRIPGSSSVDVVVDLHPAFVHTQSWDLDASVLMKVQRTLKPGETLLPGDPFGGLLKIVPEADRTELLDSFKNDGLTTLGIGDIEVTGPALVGTPLAIYR